MLRILRFVALPYLEMQENLIVYHIHGTQKVARPDLIASFHRSRPELAVECEIISMLHQYALIVARHHDNLLNHTVKDSTDLRTFCKSYIHPIIRRKLQILVHRMIFLTETVNDRSIGRPRQITLIL